MTTEQAYTKYICSNCNNKENEECEIRTRIDNTTYCKGYIKGDSIEGYKNPIYRTAKIERCVMPQLINNQEVRMKEEKKITIGETIKEKDHETYQKLIEMSRIKKTKQKA